MINCSTFLRREVCEAALRLVANCRDFGETGEITLEDDSIGIEVYPCGLAAAPDKLEDDTVLLKLIDRDPGGGAKCFAGYVIRPK